MTTQAIGKRLTIICSLACILCMFALLPKTDAAEVAAPNASSTPAPDAQAGPSVQRAKWHVSVSGNDNNIGTSEAQAFRTINKAAQTAHAGDTVIIHGGTYRETVRPLRGGGSEDTRITYRAAAGETVTVKGSEVLAGWSVDSGNVYQASMSGINFNGYNPYTLFFYNTSEKRTLGQVFRNGVELRETDSIPAVSTTPNSWKASTDGLTLYVNLNGANPDGSTMEVTVRKQVFAPSAYNLGYITVSGINFEHGANQYPGEFWMTKNTQEGIVSVNGGHDFIFENNTIRYAKTVALDIGYSGGRNFNDSGFNVVGDLTLQKENAFIYSVLGRVGHNIVRGNTITDAGTAGIFGSHADCSVIENNRLIRINTNNFAHNIFETAGIKTHWFIDGVIKDNYIKDVYGDADSIWLDNVYQGARVSGNVIVANSIANHPLHFEMSAGPLLCDNNVIIGGRGIRGNAGEGYVVAHNLFFDSKFDPPNGGGRFVSCLYTPNNPDFTGGTHDPSLLARSAHLRYYNNIFIKQGLSLGSDVENQIEDVKIYVTYDNVVDYNVYYDGAAKDGTAYTYQGVQHTRDAHSIVDKLQCNFTYTADDNGVSISFTANDSPIGGITPPVVNGVYVGPNQFTGGTIGDVDRDYFGNPMAASDPVVGPFAKLASGGNNFTLWPKTSTPRNFTRPVENLLDDKTDITYVGDGWSELPNTDKGRLGGTIHSTASDGDFFECSFYGTGVDYIGERDTDRGNVDIYIDGTFQQTVNCYNAAFQGQYKAYSKRDLAKGWHTLKGVKKSGTFMMLDALNIYNYVNDDAAGITYSGSWTDSNGKGVGNYGDNAHYTQTDNDYVEYTFWGKGIEFIAEKNSDRGNIDFYIDGIFMQTVSAYASSLQPQQVLFCKYDLDYRQHTIKAVKKSGTCMSLDAFNINQPTSPLSVRGVASSPCIIYNDDAAAAKYGNGVWQHFAAKWREGYLNDDVHCTISSNAFFEFTFCGTGIEYISDKSPTYSKNLDVYIDDVLMQTASGYGETNLAQQVIYGRYDLTDGKHKIKVVNNVSNLAHIGIDAFKVFTKSSWNDDDAAVSYGGGVWTSHDTRGLGDYNNDVHRTSDANACATLSFNGSGIRFITEKNSKMGNVRVYIDNVLQATVNCHNATSLAQQDVFTKTDLTPGSHTIKVENADAGKFLVVDRFVALKGPVLVNDDSPVFAYTGKWDRNDDVHFTTVDGSHVTAAFTGMAVEIVTEKDPTYGDMDVYIDDVFRKTLSLHNDGSRLVRQRLYTFICDMYGDHTVRLVKKSGQRMVIDAIKVYPYNPFTDATPKGTQVH